MISNVPAAQASFPSKLVPSIGALFEAAHYALDTASNRWDFAISMRQLLELGANESDLRWLVRRGLVEHGREITVEGDDGRRFRPTGNLTFTRKTCFVLSEDGAQVAFDILQPRSDVAFAAANSRCNHECCIHSSDHSGKQSHNVNPWHESHQALDIKDGNGSGRLHSVPMWDARSRKLQLDNNLVKCFKWPATNQEAILCAFQEEGWPERIYDPLPPQPEQDTKRRLADTIKCLNRNQANELLHFRGDGTGEGVVWEKVVQGR